MADFTKSTLRDNIVSLARLLQGPLISAPCPDNCGCNPTCGCESKPGCCENKCGCNQKAQDLIPNWEEIITNPLFREVVASFDTDQLKTNNDFKALAHQISSKLGGR